MRNAWIASVKVASLAFPTARGASVVRRVAVAAGRIARTRRLDCAIGAMRATGNVAGAAYRLTSTRSRFTQFDGIKNYSEAGMNKCVKCNRREVKTAGEICPTCFLLAIKADDMKRFEVMQDAHERIREKIGLRGVSSK